MQRSPEAIGRVMETSLLSCHISHLTLASTSALGSLECIIRLSHAKTHSEALTALEDYRHVQMETLNYYASYTQATPVTWPVSSRSKMQSTSGTKRSSRAV